MKFLIILSLAFFVNYDRAYAQAFGLEMAQRPEDLKVAKRLGEYKIEILPPKPHPEFEIYTAITSPKTGVCAIVATGKTHQYDRFGSSIQDKYIEIEQALQKLYGRAEKFDFLKDGALWKGNQDWVMAILSNERIYSSFWTKDGLPNNLQSIYMNISAYSASDSWITLKYEFKNYSECLAESKAASSSGL